MGTIQIIFGIVIGNALTRKLRKLRKIRKKFSRKYAKYVEMPNGEIAIVVTGTVE